MDPVTEGLTRLRNNPEVAAIEAAVGLELATGRKRHHVAIVFGSGWDRAARQLGQPRTTNLATDFPGFLAPTVPGHAGTVSSLTIGRRNILIFRGRKHLYEFPDDATGLPAILHYVRVAKAAGCKIFIHTNAVGALSPALKVGQLVVIHDHNDVITNVPSPLRGQPTFLDCSQVYDYRLIRRCREILPRLYGATMANVSGPHFETPAAAKFLHDNGCSVVGMSMIPEAILARHLGLRFLGLSLVTDAAGDPVTHDKVQAVVHRRGQALGRFLKRVITGR